jgi:hypothetical protein
VVCKISNSQIVETKRPQFFNPNVVDAVVEIVLCRWRNFAVRQADAGIAGFGTRFARMKGNLFRTKVSGPSRVTRGAFLGT